MNERALGSSGLMTPPLILGGNVFSWTIDQDVSFSVLDAFVAGGGRMIDTADVYSSWAPGNQGGESESVIGAWLSARGRRDDVLIATKVGMEMNGSKGLAAPRIANAIDTSLRRLQTDYVDLYFAHVDDAETPLEETLGAFDRLIQSGKVRAIGASNYTAARLEQALRISAKKGIASYTVLQPHYNLVERDRFEGSLQNVCVENGIAAVPYFALASGFLTGKYRSKTDLGSKARGSAVERYLDHFGLSVLKALDEIASSAGATLAQIALAWLAAQPAVAAPIASATSVKQVSELLDAMRLTLTFDQLKLLEAASRKPPSSSTEP